MDGDEVCRRLLTATPELAVVILTTFADDDLVRRCVRAGARGYLLKDIAHLDLGRNLRAVMRGEAVIDSKVARRCSPRRARRRRRPAAATP